MKEWYLLKLPLYLIGHTLLFIMIQMPEAIIITVLGLNLLGDGLRDALDPKLRGSMKK